MSHHKYIAIDRQHNIRFEDECLPVVTKKIRELIVLVHGNIIRTALIENGIYYAYGYGRYNKNKNINYYFEITVERW